MPFPSHLTSVVPLQGCIYLERLHGEEGSGEEGVENPSPVLHTFKLALGLLLPERRKALVEMQRNRS